MRKRAIEGWTYARLRHMGASIGDCALFGLDGLVNSRYEADLWIIDGGIFVCYCWQ